MLYCGWLKEWKGSFREMQGSLKKNTTLEEALHLFSFFKENQGK